MTMIRKLDPFLFSLCAGAIALAGCDTASAPPVIEPGASYEVYYQSDEGEDITLGFYKPDSAVFTTADVDWDYGGYWIEDGDVSLEVFTSGPAQIEDVTLEVGASYDANLWSDDQTSSESVTLGEIVVASAPAEDSALEAAAGRQCTRRVVYGWDGFLCKAKTGTYCDGRLVSIRVETVHIKNCL